MLNYLWNKQPFQDLWHELGHNEGEEQEVACDAPLQARLVCGTEKKLKYEK